MSHTLHITSGDIAGGLLIKSGVPGEVFVWHDILYDGPRNPGWPDAKTLANRAGFIAQATAQGLDRNLVLHTLENQYQKLADAATGTRIVLWFDACLFDQSMLAHVLACLKLRGCLAAELVCIDSFPGVEPYDGLGQLKPEDLASSYPGRAPVSAEQFDFAQRVDAAFANQDREGFEALARLENAPLPWIPAAVRRWLLEIPATGLGRLEQLALEAIRSGCDTPGRIMAAVAAGDSHPLFWGDTTLWAKINALAELTPPLVRISGPAPALPQWESSLDLDQFGIWPLPASP